MQKCRRDSFEVQYLGVGGGEGGGVCLDVQARDFAIGPSAGVVYGFVGSLVAGNGQVAIAFERGRYST